jgi:orotate phosphoribosyltransferase
LSDFELKIEYKKALSLEVEKPMVFKRKEAKDYGCKKMVEGTYREGDVCLLIEDVVVYGTSIIETSEVSLLYLIDSNGSEIGHSCFIQTNIFAYPLTLSLGAIIN